MMILGQGAEHSSLASFDKQLGVMDKILMTPSIELCYDSWFCAYMGSCMSLPIDRMTTHL